MDMKNLQVDLAHYNTISEWKPAIGDFLVHHGWLTHWYGVVSQLGSDGTIEVVTAGLPMLLLLLRNKKMEKAKKIIDIADIHTSKGGKYAAIKSIKSTIVWYI